MLKQEMFKSLPVETLSLAPANPGASIARFSKIEMAGLGHRTSVEVVMGSRRETGTEVVSGRLILNDASVPGGPRTADPEGPIARAPEGHVFRDVGDIEPIASGVLRRREEGSAIPLWKIRSLGAALRIAS